MKKPRKTTIGQDSSIRNGCLYFEDCQQCAVDSPTFADMLEWHGQCAIRVVSLATDWYQRVYLGDGVTVKETINVEMTMRPETRSGRRHWYAYRRVFGKLYKRYVGASEAIDQARLLEIARKLPTK